LPPTPTGQSQTNNTPITAAGPRAPVPSLREVSPKGVDLTIASSITILSRIHREWTRVLTARGCSANELQEFFSNPGSILHINPQDLEIRISPPDRFGVDSLVFFDAAMATRSEADGSWHETCDRVRHEENDAAFGARSLTIAIRNELTEEGIMLVLSRKLGQSFRVGPDVRVTVVKIDRNSVRIGIDAPEDVSVQRQEIVFELPQVRSLEAGAA